MDAICWGKATIAGEPSNEHDPYAITMLENVWGEEEVVLAAPLASVKPKASISSGCQYR